MLTKKRKDSFHDNRLNCCRTVIQLSTRSHEEVTGETPFSVESVMVDGQCGREMCGMMSVVLDEMLTHTVVVF
jgi:hypothetical protein